MPTGGQITLAYFTIAKPAPRAARSRRQKSERPGRARPFFICSVGLKPDLHAHLLGLLLRRAAGEYRARQSESEQRQR
jgi:hypothetical protein